MFSLCHIQMYKKSKSGCLVGGSAFSSNGYFFKGYQHLRSGVRKTLNSNVLFPSMFLITAISALRFAIFGDLLLQIAHSTEPFGLTSYGICMHLPSSLYFVHCIPLCPMECNKLNTLGLQKCLSPICALFPSYTGTHTHMISVGPLPCIKVFALACIDVNKFVRFIY